MTLLELADKYRDMIIKEAAFQYRLRKTIGRTYWEQAFFWFLAVAQLAGALWRAAVGDWPIAILWTASAMLPGWFAKQTLPKFRDEMQAFLKGSIGRMDDDYNELASLEILILEGEW